MPKEVTVEMPTQATGQQFTLEQNLRTHLCSHFRVTIEIVFGIMRKVFAIMRVKRCITEARIMFYELYCLVSMYNEFQDPIRSAVIDMEIDEDDPIVV